MASALLLLVAAAAAASPAHSGAARQLGTCAALAMASVGDLCDWLREAGIHDKVMDKTLQQLEQEHVFEVQDLIELRKLQGGLRGLFPRLSAARIEGALDAFDELSIGCSTSSSDKQHTAVAAKHQAAGFAVPSTKDGATGQHAKGASAPSAHAAEVPAAAAEPIKCDDAMDLSEHAASPSAAGLSACSEGAAADSQSVCSETSSTTSTKSQRRREQRRRAKDKQQADAQGPMTGPSMPEPPVPEAVGSVIGVPSSTETAKRSATSGPACAPGAPSQAGSPHAASSAANASPPSTASPKGAPASRAASIRTGIPIACLRAATNALGDALLGAVDCDQNLTSAGSCALLGAVKGTQCTLGVWLGRREDAEAREHQRQVGRQSAVYGAATSVTASATDDKAPDRWASARPTLHAGHWVSCGRGRLQAAAHLRVAGEQYAQVAKPPHKRCRQSGGLMAGATSD